MEEIKFTLDQAIPTDYSILKVRSTRNDILEIDVVKVQNNICVAKYITLIKPEDEEIKETLHYKRIIYRNFDNMENINISIPRILNIIGTDTIIYLNSEEELELLKSKCKNLGIQINNNTINGIALLNKIPADIKGIISNSLEILTWL